MALFVIFAILATRMKKVYPQGTTLPEFMGKRYGDRMETLYSISITIVQAYAVIINTTGALLLLGLVTGIDRNILVLILGTTMIALSMAKGIRSSFVADVFKAGMVALVLLLIVPLVLLHSEVGLSGLWDGRGGKSGAFTDPFNWNVAWTFGIPLTISLWAGVTIDQQQWQRAFSIKEGVAKTWIVGGIVFLMVPMALGALGYLAANPAFGIEVKQPQLAGFNTVAHFLPTFWVVSFTLMIVAGLVAAGASALNAFSSIGSVSAWKRIKPQSSDGELLTVSRISMILLITVGMGIALMDIELVTLLIAVGAFRGSLMIPTILSLFWEKMSGTFMFVGILTGMAAGIPLFLYGNHVHNSNISSFGILVPVAITAVACIGGTWLTRPLPFSFTALRATPGRLMDPSQPSP